MAVAFTFVMTLIKASHVEHIPVGVIDDVYTIGLFISS